MAYSCSSLVVCSLFFYENYFHEDIFNCKIPKVSYVYMCNKFNVIYFPKYRFTYSPSSLFLTINNAPLDYPFHSDLTNWSVYVAYPLHISPSGQPPDSRVGTCGQPLSKYQAQSYVLPPLFIELY